MMRKLYSKCYSKLSIDVIRLEFGKRLFNLKREKTSVSATFIRIKMISLPLLEKCPYSVFLVRIFPNSDTVQRDTEYLYVFSPNAGKHGQEKLRIRSLFMQCYLSNTAEVFIKGFFSILPNPQGTVDLITFTE